MSRIAINDLEIPSSLKLQNLEQEKQFLIKGGLDLWPFDDWKAKANRLIAKGEYARAERVILRHC